MPKKKIPKDSSSYGFVEYLPSAYAQNLEAIMSERQRTHVKFGSDKKGGITVFSMKEGLVRAGVPMRDCKKKICCTLFLRLPRRPRQFSEGPPYADADSEGHVS